MFRHIHNCLDLTIISYFNQSGFSDNSSSVWLSIRLEQICCINLRLRATDPSSGQTELLFTSNPVNNCKIFVRSLESQFHVSLSVIVVSHSLSSSYIFTSISLFRTKADFNQTWLKISLGNGNSTPFKWKGQIFSHKNKCELVKTHWFFKNSFP